MFRIGIVAGIAALAVTFAAPASAGPGLSLGAAEDTVRSASLVDAKARMTIFRLAGFRAVRITSIWTPGQSAPEPGEIAVIRNVTTAAELSGVHVYVSVMHAGSRTTPLTSDARAQFASYAAALVAAVPALTDVIVANEPNLNRFWLPQYGPDGSNAAATAYLRLLAETYDAVKAVVPAVTVWGGALAPHGSDNPAGGRPTHSPTAFIRDLGVAYRASGRTLPVMDGLAYHPYTDNSSQPPDFAHPNNTTIALADYSKLVALLGDAFDGTAQAGSTLPILYDEFGIESLIPASKKALYAGTEPSTTKPVSEETQAAYYEKALALAFCQPNVVGMLLFHSRDERELPSWQSGVYYVDETPKTSLPAVRDALDRTNGGSIARCPGIRIPVSPLWILYASRGEARRGKFRVRFACNVDCRWRVRLLRLLPQESGVFSRGGQAVAGEIQTVEFGPKRLSPGTYVYRVQLVHPVNPAPPTVRESAPLRLP
jgi:hypothetical protein